MSKSAITPEIRKVFKDAIQAHSETDAEARDLLKALLNGDRVTVSNEVAEALTGALANQARKRQPQDPLIHYWSNQMEDGPQRSFQVKISPNID